MDRETGRAIGKLFREYQGRRPVSDQDAYDKAQVAVCEVMEALRLDVPSNKVINVASEARSPEAVSRAVRKLRLK